MNSKKLALVPLFQGTPARLLSIRVQIHVMHSCTNSCTLHEASCSVHSCPMNSKKLALVPLFQGMPARLLSIRVQIRVHYMKHRGVCTFRAHYMTYL